MNERHEEVHAVVEQTKRGGAGRVHAKHYSDNERKPNKASGWRRASGFDPRTVFAGNTLGCSAWIRRGVMMVSALENAEAPDGSGETIPQWHVSMSSEGPKRCTDVEVRQALACVGMTGAEEDNHHPGVARHFWMPVDPKRRVECECKTTEVVVTEPDGYKYSEKIGACAGCELEVATGKKCERHRTVWDDPK